MSLPASAADVDLLAVVVLVWVAFALILLFVGGRRLLRSARLHSGGIEAAGTIVESQFRSGHSGRVWYRPVIIFRTATGQRVRALGPVRRKSAFPRNAPVIVRYRAERPDRVEIIDGPGEGAGGAGYIFTGLLLIVVLVTLAATLG